jgi:hypothetical protein
MSSKIVPSLNSGLGDMQVSRNPRAGINPSGDFCMQIVPPVMIMRTLASGSAIWRGDVLNSPILSRFGLPVGSKRSNELGAARRSRAVGNECQGRSEQGLLCRFCFGLRISRYQRKNEYKGSILGAQRPCKGKVGRKLMKVQTRPASLDNNRTDAFHSQLSTHDLNDSSPSGGM